MTAPENVRAGLLTALLAAFQSTKGTAVDDLSGAARLWTARAPIPAGQVVEGRTFMSSSLAPGIESLYLHPDRPSGVLRIIATPTILQLVLESNYGAYTAPDFELATQVADERWLTLAFLEDMEQVIGDVVRIRDAWIYRLDLVLEGYPGRLMLLAYFAGRSVLVGSDDAIELPEAPIFASDQSMFPFVAPPVWPDGFIPPVDPQPLILLTQDPGSKNLDLRVRKLRLTLDQQGGLDPHKWDKAALAYEVRKSGKLIVELDFESDWSDETRGILQDARDKTPKTYRLLARAENGRTLTATLHNVVFTVDPLGHDGIGYLPFHAVGRARTDGEDFFDLSLTA